MKKLAVMTVGLVVVLATISAAAQMTPPTPAPELKKLDYFIGTWNIDATIGPGPWGGGGKFTATGTDEWLKGNFFVVGHDDFSLPCRDGRRRYCCDHHELRSRQKGLYRRPLRQQRPAPEKLWHREWRYLDVDLREQLRRDDDSGAPNDQGGFADVVHDQVRSFG